MTDPADDDRSNSEPTDTDIEADVFSEDSPHQTREGMGTDVAVWRKLRENYTAAFHRERSRDDTDRPDSHRGINFGTDPSTGEIVRIDPFARQSGDDPSHILTFGDRKSGKTTAVARAAAEWVGGDSSRTLIICHTGGTPSRSITYRGLVELYEGRYVWPVVGRSWYERFAMPLSSFLGIGRLDSFVSPVPTRCRFPAAESEARVIHIDLRFLRLTGVDGLAVVEWLTSVLQKFFQNTDGETLVVMDTVNDILLESPQETRLRQLLTQATFSNAVFWLVAEPQTITNIENRSVRTSPIIYSCETYQAFRSARVPPAALEFIGFEEHDAARATVLTDPTLRDRRITCLLSPPEENDPDGQYRQWRYLSAETIPREQTILDYQYYDDGPLADYLQDQRRHQNTNSSSPHRVTDT